MPNTCKCPTCGRQLTRMDDEWYECEFCDRKRELEHEPEEIEDGEEN